MTEAKQACGGFNDSELDPINIALADRLGKIKHKIVVLSGKGGVGKSTVAVNMAVSLALKGKQVGLLDVDFHGPSVPTMLGLQNERAMPSEDGLHPVMLDNLKVMSVSFLLDDPDAPVIWRGPMKMGAVKELLAKVEWGTLDYLIIDSPPGTGDEPLSVCQLVDKLAGAVIVTTPQEVALADVRRSINFCGQLNLPILGVIENMSGFVCPHCNESVDIFKTGGGEKMANTAGVPFLGRIPLDPSIVLAGDAGKSYIQHYRSTPTAKAFAKAIEPLCALDEREPVKAEQQTPVKGDTAMKIAIPIANNQLAMHFGHCEKFALFNVDSETKTIGAREDLTPPPHEPGVLPKWLAEQKATIIIAGGMGTRAQDLFKENGLEVVVGAPAEAPDVIAQAYLDGALTTGGNICDH